MTNSERGMLTEADREFLEKDASERSEDYTPSAVTQRWDAIHERVYYGIQDLAFLFHQLPKTQRQEVFGAFEDGKIVHKRSQLLRAGAAFLLLGVAEEEDVPLDDEAFYEDAFEVMLESVLNKAGFGADKIDVPVTIEGFGSPDDAPTQNLERASDQFLRHLLFGGEITNEEFAEAILKKQDQGE